MYCDERAVIACTRATIAEIIEHLARETPHAAAVLAPGRPPLTYGSLLRQMYEVAAKLNVAGIGRNDRVALVLGNGPELATAFLTVSALATCAPLNPGYREGEFEFYLSDLKARALVLPQGIDSPARDVAQRQNIPILEIAIDSGAAAGAFSLAARTELPGASVASPTFATPADIALILHTSGTTSRPKLVPLTQANVCASARNIATTLGLTSRDCCLNVMPLFHIHGLIGATLSSLVSGGSIVCTPGWDAEQFFEWIETFHPTWYTAVPTIHQAVLAAARRRGALSSHSLRMIRSSSAALAPQLLGELETTFGVPVVEAYGMTEAAHQMCSNSPPPGRRKPGSVGVSAGPEVAIMGEAGALLGPDTTGEIVIRGQSVTAGYEDNPEANAAAYTNGWFRTGDQGYRDDDGFFFLTGRLKELINRGGEKIAPRDIDEALLTHPAVAQAVAFAVPHCRLGEDVAAAVVLHAGASAAAGDLLQFSRMHLAPHKVPSQVIVVDAIPKGPTGKVQRIGLFQKLGSLLASGFVLPATPLEEAVARIWSEVLEVDQVGTFDNFFYIGGDSLCATRVASRLCSVFEIEVPAHTVFEFPTIVRQARHIEELLLREIERLPGSAT